MDKNIEMLMAIQESQFTKLYSMLEVSENVVEEVLYLSSIMRTQELELLQILCRPTVVDRIKKSDRDILSSYSYNRMREAGHKKDLVRTFATLRYLYTSKEEYDLLTGDITYELVTIDKFLNIAPRDELSFCDFMNKRFKKVFFEPNEDTFLDVGTFRASGIAQFEEDKPRLQSPNHLRIYTSFWYLYNQLSTIGVDINQDKQISQLQVDMFMKRAEYIVQVIKTYPAKFFKNNYKFTSNSMFFFELMKNKQFQDMMLLRIYKVAIYFQLITSENQNEFDALIKASSGKWCTEYPHYTRHIKYIDDLLNNIKPLIQNLEDFIDFQKEFALWKERCLFDMIPLNNGSIPLEATSVSIGLLIDINVEQSTYSPLMEMGEFQLKRLAVLDPRLSDGTIDNLDLIRSNIKKLYK